MKIPRLMIGASMLSSTFVNAIPPTSFIDLHLLTSDDVESLEKSYLFRVSATESSFGGYLPIAPKWATHKALTASSHDSGSSLNARTSNVKRANSHPAYRLMLPPKDTDEYLCNEAKGKVDYSDPTGNSDIFNPDTKLSGYENSYILVPRGHCTFEAKARSAQRLGAAGVIVRNTLDSRYSLIDEDADETGEDYDYPDWANTKWPVAQRDYECGTNNAKGNVGVRSEIKTRKLYFYPPPYGSNNDLLLSGTAVDGNLCADSVPDFESKCPSQRCLLTGRNASDDGKYMEACCAWDVTLRMGSDGDDDDAVPQHKEERIVIPAIFVTMENGDEIYNLMKDAEKNSGSSGVQFVNVVPYARHHPSIHFSSVVVCILAIFTVWIASYQSAKEYRTSWKKISRAVNDGVIVFRSSASNANAPGRERAETEDTVNLDHEENDDDLQLASELEMTEQQEAQTTASEGTDSATFTVSDSFDADDFVGNPSFAPVDAGASRSEQPADVATPTENTNGTTPQVVNFQSRSNTAEMQNMEINAFHAVLLVGFACIFIFILFFFNLYKVVRVIYGLAGSVVMAHVLIHPLMTRLISSKRIPEDITNSFHATAFGCRGVYYKWIDIYSTVIGWTLGIAWIAVGFSLVQPMSNFYYWFMQDVMGICYCILILGVIHVNTIMVASILLTLVFIYDVFYVFISPLLFGSSMMVDVASGGGIGSSFCEKYPSDARCRGAAPLPMLIAVPWFNDFRGGWTGVGLGDIILPGLLISFGARYDSSQELVRKCSQISSIRSSGENVAHDGEDVDISNDESTTRAVRYHYHLGRAMKVLFSGYFGPLMIAYSIGLMVAYIAVWSTNKAQPALLYLAPISLGTTLCLGWKRRELADLWSGPKVLKKANRMVGVAGRIPAAARSAAALEAGQSETSSVV